MTKIFQLRTPIHYLVLASGMAALSWEVMWQIKSTLALGVSAWGTALTLAITMGGMCAGSLIMGTLLKNRTVARPALIYGALEWVIGIAGLFLGASFRAIEKLDTWVYHVTPDNAALNHLFAIAAVLGIPTMAMGATLPVLGLIARQARTSVSVLYGLNTLGAAGGVLLAAFLLIPAFGITHTIWIVSAVNIMVGTLAWTLPLHTQAPEKKYDEREPGLHPRLPMSVAVMIVSVTGFATFVLEVAWFRSLTAAFISTADAFAIMLACVLVALGAGAELASILKKKKISPGVILMWSGILILLATPVIERFDLFMRTYAATPALLFLQWFTVTLYVIGAPVLLLGVALPWVLDDQDTPRKWGILYALNTLAAIVGAISAGWFFLPALGFARTAWMAGAVVAGAGFLIIPRGKRVYLGMVAVAALLTAASFESGVGRTRVQGTNAIKLFEFARVLETHEGPDATVTATELKDGGRVLFIDGFVATQQSNVGLLKKHVHYMAWMGHLPMLLHPRPENALVICFGTGQTANAVRKENPKALDIVDINANVLKLAHHFPSNEDVLKDPRVRATVMDGRAFIRRADKTFDIITLEPMPPIFAGVNALYSQEFYQLAKSKLSAQGVMAQWLPFHLVTPHYAASIARTFQSVFPNAILWVDPLSQTGILLGSADDHGKLGTAWPGFSRMRGVRDLSEQQVRKAVHLDRKALQRYAAKGEIITDDNQLLAYGKAAHQLRDLKERLEGTKLMNTAPVLR